MIMMSHDQMIGLLILQLISVLFLNKLRQLTKTLVQKDFQLSNVVKNVLVKGLASNQRTQIARATVPQNQDLKETICYFLKQFCALWFYFEKRMKNCPPRRKHVWWCFCKNSSLFKSQD